MTTLKLRPEHQDTIIAKMLSLKSQIQYMNENVMPFLPDMEKWEAKEYSNVHAGYVRDLDEKKERIIEHEAYFNRILNHYNLTVVIFLAKFIL